MMNDCRCGYGKTGPNFLGTGVVAWLALTVVNCATPAENKKQSETQEVQSGDQTRDIGSGKETKAGPNELPLGGSSERDSKPSEVAPGEASLEISSETEASLSSQIDQSGKPEAGTAAPAMGFSPAKLPAHSCAREIYDPPPGYEESLPQSLCEWAASVDMIAVGTIKMLGPDFKEYSVSSSSVKDNASVIAALGLQDEFPWLDTIMAADEDAPPYQLVDSCPEGLRLQYQDGIFSVRVEPALAIDIAGVDVLKGKARPTLTAYVGRDQWSGGPWLSDGGWERRDGELGLNTTLGMALIGDSTQTYTSPGDLLPFTVDEDGTIRIPTTIDKDGNILNEDEQGGCQPRLIPSELAGMKLTELVDHIAQCPAGAGTRGAAIKATRLKLISGFSGYHHYAARCVVGFSGTPIDPVE